MNWRRIRTIARTDLKQLLGAKDYWMPMVALGALFFVIVPSLLLLSINAIGSVDTVEKVSKTLDMLPQAAKEQLQGTTPQARTSYALAVFLFAPMAVVVPLTISTAVGAATIVGERERGTGEFLAHSPATTKEIYIGKLIASLIPGYATTIVGFGLYSLVVNLIAGPAIGHWFFPTPQWWLLMGFIVPPFLVLTLSVVLRLSARVTSTAAAQQAAGLVSIPLIMIAYSQSTSSLLGSKTTGLIVGSVVWVLALISITRGVRSVTRVRLLGVANQA